MTLSVEDRLDISELLALHGHLVDNGELERLDELFTDDVVYEASNLGHGELRGLAAFRDMARARAGAPGAPVGHHVTNIVLTEAGDGRVHARSKGIGAGPDGECGSVSYEDVIVRGERGWRISRRRITLHFTPAGAADTEAADT
ncbi:MULTISPECIES: nuclear transport factor 2 family protein [unclassified Streptomyces]|uniref:nuclear transport factor 2 family protein n=1 Tax=unclassified Streptomyces TaxID=2593676 RepID=UPI002E79C232|nr:nuclear transport factor 2 family protein [Streptomyces sp. JV190]MEE1845537.1 nuclear transport factor 2 family protein [Streptomyces sp. JV190]